MKTSNYIVEEFDAVVMLVGVEWEARISAVYDHDAGWRVVGLQLGACDTGAGKLRFKVAAEVDLASLTPDDIYRLSETVEAVELEGRKW